MRLLALCFLLGSSVATATTLGPGSVLDLPAADVTPAAPLSPELRACLTRKPIGFGASVMQATAKLIPGYQTLISRYEAYEAGEGLTPQNPKVPKPTSYRRFGWSPLHSLTKMLGGKAATRNVLHKGAFYTDDVSKLGGQQIHSLLHGELKKTYQEASLLMAVDAFYWDAEWDACGSWADPIPHIEELTRKVRAHGKTLILGTVPHEDPRLVRIDIRRIGYDFAWRPPRLSCLTKINEALHRLCTPENNCYLVDLKGDIDVLKEGGKLEVAGVGSFDYYEMRPDGVHLSDMGVLYIAQTVMKAFQTHPPICF